jgi:hypothetical protein
MIRTYSSSRIGWLFTEQGIITEGPSRASAQHIRKCGVGRGGGEGMQKEQPPHRP